MAHQAQDRADHPDQAFLRLKRLPEGFQAGVVDDLGSLDPGVVASRLLGPSPERRPRPFEIRLRERGLLAGSLVDVVLKRQSGDLLAGEGPGQEELVQP
jgi:hypothetical protein